jgi:hypothetical protein
MRIAVSMALTLLALIPPHSVGQVSQDAFDSLLITELSFRRTANVAELERILGKPASVSSRSVNIDGTDPGVLPGTERGTLSTLSFKGLVIEVYESAVDGRTIVKTIDLRSNGWKFPRKIRIGDAEENVRALLGEPTKSEPNVFSYESRGAYLDTVHFHFNAGKVVRILWTFEI